MVNPKKIIPATVEFIDIAGIVKEAHKGEGLGNKFLSHIRECDAICMVLRCFEDENIMHVAGKIDPKDDMETIITELELADLETKEKIQAKAKKDPTAFENLKFLSDKPIIYAFNVSEQDSSLSSEQVIEKFNLKSKILNLKSSIVISAKVEEDLIDLNPEEQKEYLESLGLQKSGLDRLIQSAYDTLGLQSYFTAGPDEVRAWTINKGDKAPRAAGKIHTDFEKGFIKAAVISYDDFVKYNGESGAKTAGKLRLEGKDYVVQDGDVIEFKFNV
ncbi:MAG: GTP-binding protein [uncultured bacterium]|nr:MAG: GTP-binding protein [uncultured bacterium]